MSGVAFLTRTYWESNLNTAIATKVNNVSGAGWIVGYRWLGLSIVGVHYSNGRFRMPNLGINTVVGGLVVRWMWQWDRWRVPVSGFQPVGLPKRSDDATWQTSVDEPRASTKPPPSHNQNPQQKIPAQPLPATDDDATDEPPAASHPQQYKSPFSCTTSLPRRFLLNLNLEHAYRLNKKP